MLCNFRVLFRSLRPVPAVGVQQLHLPPEQHQRDEHLLAVRVLGTAQVPCHRRDRYERVSVAGQESQPQPRADAAARVRDGGQREAQAKDGTKV